MGYHEQFFALARFAGYALALVNSSACSSPGGTPGDTGATSKELVNLSVSGNVTCMRAPDLQAKCWGRGTWAQHGVQTTDALGDDEPVASIPLLPLGTGVEQISASFMSVCALLEGRLDFRCWGGTASTGAWGYPFHGILGDDEPISDGQVISVSSTIEAIDASARTHTCILLEGGTMKCFGVNGYGQLGYGHTDSLCDEPNETVESLPTVSVGGPVVELALADNSTSCVRMVDGSVKCWGNNAGGILAQPDHPDAIGDDDVPADYPPIELAGESVVQLSAGPQSICAVHADGALSCWGYVSAALGYAAAAAGVGTFIGDFETPASIGHVDVGAKVAQVAAGRYHTCAVLSDGGVKCWGIGTLVALGYGTTEIVGDDESPATLEPLALGGPAESVHVGERHSCVVLKSGDVKCWGAPVAALGYGNGEGPLGDDETLEGLPALDLGSW